MKTRLFTYIFSSILLVLVSCEIKRTANSKQLEKSYASIDCYKKLNGFFLKDSLFQQIKDNAFNPKNRFMLAKDPDYRLIRTTKILPFIDSTAWNDCHKQLKEHRNFKGIRIVNKQLMIFEIAINRRYRYMDHYNRYPTYEITRLIYNQDAAQTVNWEKCCYGDELRVRTTKFNNDWTLVITKVESMLNLENWRYSSQ